MNYTHLTDARIEELAKDHEAFGFGLVDAKGFTTHGFDPKGIGAFARAVEEAAMLDRIAQQPEWQVIETAPKDGTFILLLDENQPSAVYLIARWRLDCWRGQRTLSGKSIIWGEATHWMPLPPPPEPTP
jgi:hypothetical protein